MPKKLTKSDNAPDSARAALIDDMLAKLRQQLEEQLPGDNATLDQIEDAAGKIGRKLSQDIKSDLVQQRNDQQGS